jgi:hypothetical protein
MVDYRILGPLEVSADGRVIEICCRTSALQTSGERGDLGRSDGLLGMTVSCLSVAGFRPHRQARRPGNVRGRGQLTPF